MTFNTALSGLRAANTDLEITGNNIANASTVGFKKSRAEFGDVYANSLIGSGGNSAGSGVLVSDVAQQFDQGNVSFTDNALDLAIDGSGFFVLEEPSLSVSYTRGGYFGIDKNGFIVTNNGSKLIGRSADSNGNINGGSEAPLVVDTSDLAPQATGAVSIDFNLDSREEVPAVTTFDPNDPLSFNRSTSVPIYDSRGELHTLSVFYEKTATNNVWNMHAYIPDSSGVLQNVVSAAGGAGGVNPYFELTFGTGGVLQTADPAVLNIDAWDPDGGNQSSTTASTAIFSDFTIGVTGSTQFGSNFSAEVGQDGFAPGQLSGLEIDASGILFARYTSGEALTLGKVVLASFNNVQGLSPRGDSTWVESFASGAPSINDPLSGSLGAIQAGALEESNVDLSEELVHLIIAQRNFQANAKTIETADTVTQAIINIR